MEDSPGRPATLRIRIAAWLIDSLIAVLTLGVATVLIWPDLVTISLSAVLDDDVRELPSYHQFVAVAALTFFGSVLGMLGLRSPAAALAGLRIVDEEARRASPLQHLFRGLACAAIYVALIFWLALVLALDEMFRPQAAGFRPGWILDQVFLLLVFGGSAGILLIFLWSARDPDRRTLHDIATRTRVVRAP